MFEGRLVVLYTDLVMWFLVLVVAVYVRHVMKTPELASKWHRVLANKTAVACGAVLSVFFLVVLADSVHYRAALQSTSSNDAVVYDTRTVSLLDDWIGAHIAGRERSYSAPFALREFDKTTVLVDGKPVREFQRLTGAARDVPEKGAWIKLMRRIEVGGLAGLAGSLQIWLVAIVLCMGVRRISFGEALRRVVTPANPWRPAISVWMLAVWLGVVLMFVWPDWHVLGTDRTGNDVLFSALKSVRTAVVIGSLATFSMLPFAVVLGIAAGYFKGWVDDVIQYVYTTISSIPSVLLIAASVLMIQVFIDKNPTLYETGLERADMRLFCLALIIGVTGWATLARLLRAETMKICAMDFVTAAKAFGVSPWRIMARHVLPNVAHIVLIVTVLDFSGIVLYEAVLSYVGVGVDPVMESFGSMINAAAIEMSRSPVIWWNLAASFAFMFVLVLSANLFASGVRDAFDPKARPQGGGNA